MTARFKYQTVASPLQPNTDGFESIIGEYIPSLDKLGGTRQRPEDAASKLPLFYFVVTGGTENEILKLQAQRDKISPNEPVFLLAHPGNNSLPASLEVLARLQQNDIRGRIFYLSGPNDTTGYQQIAEALTDIAVKTQLNQTRIGLLGMPSDWLVASAPETSVVKQVWGPTVIPIEMEDVEKQIELIAQEQMDPHLKSLQAETDSILEPTEESLQDAVKVYLGLKNVVNAYHLNALTIRCFDLVMKMKTTGCWGLAQLTDDGIIGGCEGDLMSLIGMLWTNKLLNQTPWMANPAQLDQANNALWLAHCTVPPSLVKDYRLRSHFESGLGVGIQGSIAPGPTTLLRIGGKNMEKLWLAEGAIEQAGYAENLCRTQVEIRLEHGGKVADLLRSPLGNHLVMVQGSHLDRLHTWWETMIE